jgi:hypothetical protein
MADIAIKYNDGQCQEGCGKQTAKGRRFVQGHDARLRSVLYGAVREDKSLTVNGKSVKPSDHITSYGWPQPAERKPRKRAAAKSTAKKSTAKKSAAKKETSKAKDEQAA